MLVVSPHTLRRGLEGFALHSGKSGQRGLQIGRGEFEVVRIPHVEPVEAPRVYSSTASSPSLTHAGTKDVGDGAFDRLASSVEFVEQRSRRASRVAANPESSCWIMTANHFRRLRSIARNEFDRLSRGSSALPGS
jgi:hypothetical protein